MLFLIAGAVIFAAGIYTGCYFISWAEINEEKKHK